MTVEWGKVAAVLAVLTSATLLAALGRVDVAVPASLYTLTLGYVFGNGRLASKGQPPVPMIGAKPSKTLEHLAETLVPLVAEKSPEPQPSPPEPSGPPVTAGSGGDQPQPWRPS